jgi:hypothetical protein
VDIVGSSIGAAAILAGICVGVALGRRSQANARSRTTWLDAYLEAIRCYFVMHDQFSDWARSGRRPSVDWPTWARGLYMIRLVAPLEVVTIAEALDGQFRDTEDALNAGREGYEGWLKLQGDLDATLLKFVNAARHTIDVRSRDLIAAAARPEPDTDRRSSTRTISLAWGVAGQPARRAPVL